MALLKNGDMFQLLAKNPWAILTATGLLTTFVAGPLGVLLLPETRARLS